MKQIHQNKYENGFGFIIIYLNKYIIRSQTLILKECTQNTIIFCHITVTVLQSIIISIIQTAQNQHSIISSFYTIIHRH